VKWRPIHREAARAVKQVFPGACAVACVALGSIGATYAMVTSIDWLIPYVVAAAVAALIVAIVLEQKNRPPGDRGVLKLRADQP
jgi:hypothetical protein